MPAGVVRAGATGTSRAAAERGLADGTRNLLPDTTRAGAWRVLRDPYYSRWYLARARGRGPRLSDRGCPRATPRMRGGTGRSRARGPADPGAPRHRRHQAAAHR